MVSSVLARGTLPTSLPDGAGLAIPPPNKPPPFFESVFGLAEAAAEAANIPDDGSGDLTVALKVAPKATPPVHIFID